MNLIYLILLLSPPSWEFTGEIQYATNIYSIIEAQDGSLIAGGSASSGSYRLWRSSDEGNTWIGVGPSTTYSFRCLLKTSSGVLYAGRDDGWIYRSNDNGQTWTSIIDLGLSVLYLFQSSSGRIFAGTATDNQEIAYSDDGNSWHYFDLPGNLDVNCFAQFSSGRIVCGTNSAQVYYSDDNGQNWSQGGTLQGATACYTLAIYNNELYAGTNNASGEIYKSNDFAQSFTNLGDKLTYASAVYDIFFRSDTMYVGTGNYGEVAKSFDFGQNFDYTRNADGATYVYKILEKSGKLYIATGGYGDIFRSNNNLVPDYNVATLSGANNVLTLEFYNNDLYAGTDNASGEIYKSTDFAQSFVNLGNNMPTANAVYDLLFVDQYLFAGTSPNGDVLMSEDFGNYWINTGDLQGATYVYKLLYKLYQPYQYRIYAGTGQLGDVFRSTEFLGEGEFTSPKPIDSIDKEDFKMFPISTFFNDKIEISFSSLLKKPLKIELFNALGEKVYEISRPYTYSLKIYDEKIKKLGKGVYFLKIYIKEKEFKRLKLVKK